MSFDTQIGNLIPSPWGKSQDVRTWPLSATIHDEIEQASILEMAWRLPRSPRVSDADIAPTVLASYTGNDEEWRHVRGPRPQSRHQECSHDLRIVPTQILRQIVDAWKLSQRRLTRSSHWYDDPQIGDVAGITPDPRQVPVSVGLRPTLMMLMPVKPMRLFRGYKETTESTRRKYSLAKVIFPSGLSRGSI